jgi:hypothetical protein
MWPVSQSDGEITPTLLKCLLRGNIGSEGTYLTKFHKKEKERSSEGLQECVQ